MNASNPPTESNATDSAFSSCSSVIHNSIFEDAMTHSSEQDFKTVNNCNGNACVLTNTPISSHKQSLVYTQGADILRMYQLLKDVHDLFTWNELAYWIHGGTLLGAVRHHGLIPWDDDLDVFIWKTESEKFLAMKDQLKMVGYSIIQWWYGGYRIYCDEGRPIPGNCKFPYLDVFFADTDDQGRILFTSQRAMEKWGYCCTITANETFPLKTYLFGSLRVMGPKDSDAWLNKTYGSEWNKIAFQEKDHQTGLERPKNTQPLVDRSPALPVGPLSDHVHDLLCSIP